MNKIALSFKITILCCAVSVFNSCNSDEQKIAAPEFEVIEVPTTSEIEFTPAESKVNDEINSFGAEALGRILKKQGSDNIAFSPIGAVMSLSLFENAVRLTNQGTAKLEEMILFDKIEDVNSTIAKLMCFLQDASQCKNVAIANSLWVNDFQSISEELKSVLHKSYFAELFAYDYSLDDIQQQEIACKWVAFKTRGEISRIVFTRETRVNAINANYFKDSWETKFDRSKTTQMPFYGPQGTESVDMMFADIDNVNYVKTEDWESIALPFNGNYEMVFVLPNKNCTLGDCIEALSMDRDQICNSEDISVWLPKFSIENELNLNNYYPDLGTVLTQTAKISVDEDGATAASVTISQDSYRAEIKFDRPFLYAITNRTTSTNFMLGAVVSLK